MNRSRLKSLIAAGAITIGALVTLTAQASVAQAQPGQCLSDWDGQWYPQGAKVYTPGGHYEQCQHDETWKQGNR
jgi:hypothetical protein